MIVEQIEKILEMIPEAIRGDFGIYVGAAIAVLTFLVALVLGLVGKGELSKFVSLARAAVKDGTQAGINASMQKMPAKVKKQYKRAMMTGAKPSDIVSVDAAVIAPYTRSGISKLPLVTAVGTFVGAGVGFGLALALSLGNEGLTLAVVGILGGILMIVAAVVSSLTFKGAMKAYDNLTELLDGVRSGSAQAHAEPEREEVNANAQSAESYVGENSYATYEASEPQHVYEQEQAEYESPVYEQQAQYAEPVMESEPQSTSYEQEEERARAREEALAAQRAEQEERERQAAAEKAAAAQKRLEELRAQREAQLKARRQAQAQQNAGAHAANGEPAVTTEDVIARIDKIDTEGASLASMKEVAMLLQKERVKPENKTPEQQKKLNEALSKLLKAMSAAQKK